MIGLVLLLVFAFFGMILLFFSTINGDGKSHSNHSSDRKRTHRKHRRSGFFDSESNRKRNSRPSGNPFDNHWESSFYWKDKDNDGYDDRDNGFWNEREF